METSSHRWLPALWAGGRLFPPALRNPLGPRISGPTLLGCGASGLGFGAPSPLLLLKLESAGPQHMFHEQGCLEYVLQKIAGAQ